MKFELLVFAAVILSCQAIGQWKGGLSVRFGVGLLPGRSFFIPVPQTLTQAKNQRWVETPRPAGQPRPGLVLYNPSRNDVVLGAFYDNSGAVAGLQIALPKDSHTDPVLNWEIQGFSSWTAPPNNRGERREYWVTALYFVSEATHALSPAEKLASRQGRVVSEDFIYVNGFDGELTPISTKASEIANTAKSKFTRQACVVFMGTHYYYNMTVDTECTSRGLFPWFPLVDTDTNQLIGTGLLTFGKLPARSLVRDYFERPTASNVRMIVPTGPECISRLAGNPGVVTMHIYFVDAPLLINCFF